MTVIKGHFGQQNKPSNTFDETRSHLDIPDLIEYLQEGFDHDRLEETRSELKKLGVNPDKLEM